MAENLWKQWYFNEHGVEFVPYVEDESDDETEDYEEEKKEDTPLWVTSYLKPSSYIPAVDDIEDSDDELDLERRVAIDVPKDDIGGAHLRSMFGSLLKKTDEVVQIFPGTLNEKTKAFTENRKKLFNLKIKLLNTKEDIYRTVQVSFYL